MRTSKLTFSESIKGSESQRGAIAKDYCLGISFQLATLVVNYICSYHSLGTVELRLAGWIILAPAVSYSAVPSSVY